MAHGHAREEATDFFICLPFGVAVAMTATPKMSTPAATGPQY
jgi:hypothetical protein